MSRCYSCFLLVLQSKTWNGLDLTFYNSASPHKKINYYHHSKTHSANFPTTSPIKTLQQIPKDFLSTNILDSGANEISITGKSYQDVFDLCDVSISDFAYHEHGGIIKMIWDTITMCTPYTSNTSDFYKKL